MKFSTVTVLTALASLAAANPLLPRTVATTTSTKTVTKVATTTTTVSTVTVTKTATTYTTTTKTKTKTANGCLSTSDATTLVNDFASLLTDYNNNTANAILADDFTDTSDSINYLAGIPLGDVTFASKAAFMQGQGSQPAIGFNVLQIDAVTCNTIAFRWEAFLGNYPVKGIEVFHCSKTGAASTANGWQIELLYSEFNVGAWELDIGNTCGNGATVASS